MKERVLVFRFGFSFILVNNWIGLIPGVGTIGWHTVDSTATRIPPLLRGGNADLNMTAAMALTFAMLWFYWAITENGLKAFSPTFSRPRAVSTA